jgi:hypothetical protein
MVGRMVNIGNVPQTWLTDHRQHRRGARAQQIADAHMTNRILWAIALFLVLVVTLALVGIGVTRTRRPSAVPTWTTEPTSQQIATHQ